MTIWITPANMKFYDVLKAYSTLNELDWRLTSTPSIGDIVYIYLAHPYRCVKFKTLVVGTNIPYSERIKDEIFYTDKIKAHPNGKLYTRLSLIQVLPDNKITRDFLLANGVKGSILSMRRLPEQCIDALSSIQD